MGDSLIVDGAATPASDPFPQGLVESLLDGLADRTRGARPCGITVRDEHSNDLAEIRFTDGRTLMVKRGREAWAAERFEASRRAARLLRERSGVVVPEHLDLPERLDGHACIAYWRIPLPTLKELWPELPEAARPAVLRSWGVLIRRIHDSTFQGHGPLDRVVRAPASSSLAGFLADELERRLLPAVSDVWPSGRPVVERLIAAMPDIAARAGGGAVLVHGDLHMDNVLCDTAAGAVRCVGALDLEGAFAGPPEAELAAVHVLHGPLFAHPLEGAWLQQVLAGYGRPLDAHVLGFFRAYHLTNMGFHAALVGHHEHAGDVAHAALREADALAAIMRRVGSKALRRSGA